MLADLEQRAVYYRQEWRVQSANLTQVLAARPAHGARAAGARSPQVTLIDPARPLDELMPIALVNRPEVASRSMADSGSRVRSSNGEGKTFMPNVLLNGFQTPYEMIQAGIFGIGPNSSMNQWKGRFDFSIQPLWQVSNMGLGNLAAIKSMRGVESMAIIDFFKSQDAAAADVTRAVARVQSAAVRVAQADRALRTGHHHL